MTSRVGPAKKRMVVGPAAFDGGAVAAGGEVGGGGEVGAVAGFGGLAGQPDGEVGLAGAGRADEQHVGGRFEVAAGGQLVDQGAVGGGLGVVVELLQGGRGRAGRRTAAGRPAGGPRWRRPRGRAAVPGPRSATASRRRRGRGRRGGASAAVCSLSAARWPRSCW